MRDAGQTLTMVALETGSRWPMWLADVRLGEPGLVTVVQHADQSLALLVTRVLRLLAEAEPNGGARIVALACNERIDRNAVVARAQIIKAALASMARTGGGRALLTADDRLPDGVRQSIAALAHALDEGRPGHDVSVTASFGSHASGLFPAARPGSAAMGSGKDR